MNGKTEAPGDRFLREFVVWEIINKVVVGWLTISLTDQVSDNVEATESASDIWTMLYMYSGSNNPIKDFQLHDELDNVVHEDRTISEYAALLKKYWSDLDHYDPIGVEDEHVKSSFMKHYQKFMEYVSRQRMMKFMKGINPAFEQRRNVLLAQPGLPLLEEAIAAMTQEEARLKLMPSTTSTPGMKSVFEGGDATTVEILDTSSNYVQNL